MQLYRVLQGLHILQVNKPGTSILACLVWFSCLFFGLRPATYSNSNLKFSGIFFLLFNKLRLKNLLEASLQSLFSFLLFFRLYLGFIKVWKNLCKNQCKNHWVRIWCKNQTFVFNGLAYKNISSLQHSSEGLHWKFPIGVNVLQY